MIPRVGLSIMAKNKIVGDIVKAMEADESAMGAINRPLRASGLFCSSA